MDNASTLPSKAPSAVFSDDGRSSSPASSAYSADSQYSSDIAIVGYGCRTAGGNNTPSQLWEYLLAKGDANGEIPEKRFKPWNKRQPGNEKVLEKVTKRGYFLDRIEDFDAQFFNISPREAEQMDPQQRIALEVAWEALEDAGIAPQSLSGSDTAVFMGVNSDDYSRLVLEDLENVQAWMGVGTAYCGIPNRISYILNLMGPTSAIDAACASSLVAVHHAKQALMSGETSLAMAGGVNALLGPGLTKVLDEAGAVSPDGRCCSFDDRANGYGRGEGAGVVIMKRLSDAVHDNDRILAVLKGSAVGGDGKTNGIMAPNGVAQEMVARRALREAKISPDTISYVEGHATSTPLGDRTECDAMANVYGSGARSFDNEPCLIGSIKSNIGHLEAGAGVMGLIKAIMVAQTGIVPPQANLVNLSTKIDWKKNMLHPVMEATPLPENDYPRRIAIASYGYGGTVSHAVIEQAPAGLPVNNELISRKRDAKVLLLSSPKASRIQKIAAELKTWMQSPQRSLNQHNDLDSIAYTLAAKRGHHANRTAIVVEDDNQAFELLDKVAQGQKDQRIIAGKALNNDHGKGTTWVFSGHGAHWPAMGKKLLATEPVFESIVKQLEPLVKKELGFSLRGSLQTGDFMDSTDKIQILTYVMQVGLASILSSNGVEPDAIVGHSMGEVAASVVSGCLTVNEGAFVCCVRARLYRQVMGKGSMILVSLPYEDVKKELDGRDDIAVAIDSSPSSCVVSGNIRAIKDYSEVLKERNVQVRVVKSDVAFHSPLLLPLVKPLREALQGALNPKAPMRTLYSTASSNARGQRSRNADYWVDNMIRPVLLSPVIQAAANDGYRVFLEVSSHPIVAHSINETLATFEFNDTAVIPTLQREKDADFCLFAALSKLHVAGQNIDFKQVLPGTWSHDVPFSEWDHQAFWREVAEIPDRGAISHDPSKHLLLGSKVDVNGLDATLWKTFLEPSCKPFPGNHPLHGSEIVPACVLVNTFLSAVPGNYLHDVSLRSPVVVGPVREVQVLLNGERISISSRLAGETAAETDNYSFLTNTMTKTAPAKGIKAIADFDMADLRKRLNKEMKNTFSIDYLADVGVSEMGFPWQVTKHMEAEGEFLATVDADPTANPSPHFGGQSWASILDAATSVSSTIFYKEPLLRMPTSINKVVRHTTEPPPKITEMYVKRVEGEYAADVYIMDEAGKVLIEIECLKFAGIEGDITSGKSENVTFQLAWPPVHLAEKPNNFKRTLMVGDNSSLTCAYHKQLRSSGKEVSSATTIDELSEIDEGTAVLFMASGTDKMEDVHAIATKNCKTAFDIVKRLKTGPKDAKLFIITEKAIDGATFSSLAQGPLVGLSRIFLSEIPEIFGGLIDVEDEIFPTQAVKYAKGVDVIKMEDAVARNARLRPISTQGTQGTPEQAAKTLKLKSHGTYLITGGLGALGFEIAGWLAEKGAKRIVLISRRKLPPRSTWAQNLDNPEIQKIIALEKLGVSVYAVSVDMTALDAAEKLQERLDELSLPPVFGAIHAAGTLANQLVEEVTTDKFNSVIDPKILGATALHKLYPPGSLDFMVLFSSCGQLLGFTGQAAYASGNAFLDSMAAHRRAQGDNSIAIQWTSWRALGMASSTRFIDAELRARGIADVTPKQAFASWEQIARYDTPTATVLRTLPLDADEELPHPILGDVVVRNVPTGGAAAAPADDGDAEPTSGPELDAWMLKKVKKAVANTLSTPEEGIDPSDALIELGVDSVMTVELRTQLQKGLGVKVGPTLIWNCPTVNHLVKHFVAEKSK